MSMIGSRYQTKVGARVVLITGDYEGTNPQDDPPGLYYRYVEKGKAIGPTHFMSQSSVPHRLEGPICERCQIVKSKPGSHMCGSCGEAV